jgi:hypothetical protein
MIMTQPNEGYVWIEVADLHMDWSYQRPTSNVRVRKIIEEFDPRKIGILTVSKRDHGELFVVDGGHRVKALSIMGIVGARCDVWTGLDRADEAELYVWLNSSQKKLTALDSFRGRVVAGDETALIVSECMDKADYRPTCVGAMTAAIKEGMDPGSLETALRWLKAANSGPGKDVKRYTKIGTVLMALAKVIDDHDGKVDELRMVDKTLITKYRDVNGAFAQLGEMGSRDRPGKAARALAKQYNRTRGTKLYPESDQD